MSRETRLQLIASLEKARGTHVISYFTSTRDNLDSYMAMDVIPVIYRHLTTIPGPRKGRKIDLFLHTNGGDGVVPWRLVTLIREFCDTFCVLVPNRAFSAGTLTALGADKVLMHPMGMLGPTDPTVITEFNPKSQRVADQLLGISVEDVGSYIDLVKDDVGIGHEDELIQAVTAMTNEVNPLALGAVKRLTSQSKMLGKNLLRLRDRTMPLHELEEITNKLTSQLFYHGHPISRSEARDTIGLSFVEDPSARVGDAMWSLFEAYATDMRLNEPYNPVVEAIRTHGPLPIPGPQAGGPPVLLQEGQPGILGDAVDVPLETLKTAFVESLQRCDVYELDITVTLRRSTSGGYLGLFGQMRSEWTTE
jgi:hypothetical protein